MSRRDMAKVIDWVLINSLVCLAICISSLVFCVYRLGVVKEWWAI